MTETNHDFVNKHDLFGDRYYYVGLVESFDSSFEQQVSDPDEFDFSYEFFNSCIVFVPTDSTSLVDICFCSEVDHIDFEPSCLGTIDSSFLDSSLNTPFVEDSKVACDFAKVNYIEYFILNVILMLLFLGDNIFSWIHNCLLAFPCCSSCNCSFMYPFHAYAPDYQFPCS